jgi:hypothetical protein
MSAAAHYRPQPRVYNPLKSLRHVFSGLAYLNSTHAIRPVAGQRRLCPLFIVS